MAQIVFGMAIPHSAMLGKPGETWLDDGQRDRANPALIYRNREWTFRDLVAERSASHFEEQLSDDVLVERKARCDAAIAQMRAAYEAADVDIVVIIGKDQKEIFIEHSPSIAVYSGEEIHNGPPQKLVFAPDHPVTYPGHPDLARHILSTLGAQGFDLTDLMKWPENKWMRGARIVPHAFGFVYHQIMSDQPTPSVPVLMNTFFAPTQPSMTRALSFGKALVEAIRSWEVDARVAVIASGGLSHFVCDEEFDREIIDYLAKGDLEALEAVDDRSYQSGNSEVKLYAPVAVAMDAIGAKMTLVDYVPCYRTEAGTGEGMGFMYWQ